MPVPDQTTIPTSERGFQEYTEFVSVYGDTVRAYESSSAMAPHVWVNIATNDPHPTHEPGKAIAHLNVEQAIQLRDALDTFISCIPERWEEGISLLPESERERQRKMRNTTEEVSE